VSPARRASVVLALGLFVVPLVTTADIGPLSPEGETADLVLERADWVGFAPLSLEELLRHFAGIHFARRGGLGAPQFATVLGSVTGHIQVVLDGVEMNEVDTNWSRFFGIPVSHIERILVHRTEDPVRIEIWTRPSRESRPVTDIDVARGTSVTRTRRLRFTTPERPVQASLHYEELLRGVQEFRVDPQSDTGALGSYAGRGRWIDGLLLRPNEDHLRFRHFDFVDDSNGSYESSEDATHTRRIQNSLRWTTSLLGRRLVLDLTNLTWDRSRTLTTGTTRWTDTRNSVGGDWRMVSGERLQVQARLRGWSASTMQDPGPQGRLSRARQWDAGVDVRAGKRLQWQASGAVHDHQRHGTSWSGRLGASWRGDLWSASAAVGRGVSFAGTTADAASGDTGLAVGHSASAGVQRQGEHMQIGVRLWGKDFDGRLPVTQGLFPLLGAGPDRVGGAMAEARWDASHRNWRMGLGAQISWVPWVDGERGGLPEVQTELLARLARLDWFEGDLSVTVQAVWHAESRREFTQQTVLAAYQETGFDLNVRLLHRIVFFWHIGNAWDEIYETHPNVLMPARHNLFGVQVLLFD
jgi:hypothetical protein